MFDTPFNTNRPLPMRSRFEASQPFHHSTTPYSLFRQPREFSWQDRSAQPIRRQTVNRLPHSSVTPDLPPADNITTSELNGFALSCIEKLAFPSGQNHSVEDTIAITVMEKLPSYTVLKATLKTQTENHVWSQPIQNGISQLRNKVEHMEETIATHLIRTGEEIGLPGPLLDKLADLTKAVLARYAA